MSWMNINNIKKNNEKRKRNEETRSISLVSFPFNQIEVRKLAMNTNNRKMETIRKIINNW